MERGLEEVEGMWRGEVEVLEETCGMLRRELGKVQEALLENRKRTSLRRHYDEEVERWVQELNERAESIEAVIGAAREALEGRIELDASTNQHIQDLMASQLEAKEMIQRLIEAKAAAEEEHQQPHFDVSLLTLNSQVINEVDEWSDHDDNNESDPSPVMLRPTPKKAPTSSTTTTSSSQWPSLPTTTLFLASIYLASTIDTGVTTPSFIPSVSSDCTNAVAARTAFPDVGAMGRFDHMMSVSEGIVVDAVNSVCVAVGMEEVIERRGVGEEKGREVLM
ncbi:hypothetical protein HDU98_001223 [Podochytrium sp. JEL0797]|nr:hypothetical protein HDU98_001223 [Podochytrium sp. JEL0797]